MCSVCMCFACVLHVMHEFAWCETFKTVFDFGGLVVLALDCISISLPYVAELDDLSFKASA